MEHHSRAGEESKYKAKRKTSVLEARKRPGLQELNIIRLDFQKIRRPGHRGRDRPGSNGLRQGFYKPTSKKIKRWVLWIIILDVLNSFMLWNICLMM